jgi:hypothetical protein
MKYRVLGRPIVVCTIRARQAREKETVLLRLHAKIDEQVSHTSASNVAEIQLGVVPGPYFLIWISPFPGAPSSHSNLSDVVGFKDRMFAIPLMWYDTSPYLGRSPTRFVVIVTLIGMKPSPLPSFALLCNALMEA